MHADQALKKVLSLPGINTVLDIGCGRGVHSFCFEAHGKKVTGIDIGKEPVSFNKNFTFIC